jgi:hypothetical protein
MARKRRNSALRPELRVVFDTSVLSSESAKYLLRHEVFRFIKDNSNHPELKVVWYLPEVVVHERRYQMQSEARKLLPAIEKTQDLLSRDLGVNMATLESAVKAQVVRQADEMGLAVLPLDLASVDWRQLILDSAYRNPPFEQGQKEKGFRDALIAESFRQLAAQSPRDPKACRLVLVTGDSLLAQAVTASHEGAPNVNAPVTLEELKGLVNTLLSEVSEVFIRKVKPKAEAYFFVPGDATSLLERENILAAIEAGFRKEITQVPEGCDRRQNGPWVVSPPNFAKKEDGRFSWVSQVTMRQTAYKILAPLLSTPWSIVAASSESPSPVFSGTFIAPTTFSSDFPSPSSWQAPMPTSSWSSALSSSPSLSGSAPSSFHSPELFPLPREVVRAAGATVFEIKWSVSISAKHVLSAPKVEGIRLVSTTWE